MSDNLSIVVSADTSSLQAQLAIARAEVAAYAAEVRKAAGAVVGGDSTQLGGLEQLATKLAAARGEVSALTSQLGGGRAAHEAHAGAIHATNEALSSMISPITGAIGGLREMAEIIGVAFAVEKVFDFVKEMAESAEKTENLSFAVGIAAEEYSKLSVGFQVGGGDAETATRALIRLQQQLVEAASGSGKARDALLSLGIPIDKIKELAASPEGPVNALHMISDAVKEFGDSPGKTDVLKDLFSGRQLANVAPLLRKDWGELQAIIEKTGAAFTDDQVKRWGELAEQGNILKLSFQGLVKDALDPYIDKATKGTEATIGFVQRLRELNKEADKKIGEAAGEAAGIVAKAPLPPKTSGDWAAAGIPPKTFDPTDEERAFLAEARRRENASGPSNLLHYPAPGQSRTVDTLEELEAARVLKNSHAFGNYGFQPGTYREMAAKTGLSDLSEASQDVNALELLRRKGTAPWPWAAGEVQGPPAPKPLVNDYKSAKAEKDLEKDIKALEEWSKVEAKGYDVGIQKAKDDGKESALLQQQKIEMLQRTAVQEQALREQAAQSALAHGDPDLAEKMRTGGGSLQEKELGAEKELIALKQRGNEVDAESALKRIETDRRISDQETQTALQGVERQRQAGDITAADAEAREIRIVQSHLAALEKIYDDEAAATEKVKKLHDEVANHRKEAEARAGEEIQRIHQKAQEEEEARAHAIDKQLASEFASSAVGLAWGKQTPLQALGGLEQKIETKTLDFVGAKLLDASGIGHVLDKLGDQITSKLFGTAVDTATKSATETLPIVTAITGTGPIATATALTPVMEAQTGQIVAAILGGASTGAGGSIIGGAVSGGLGLAAKGFAGGPAVAATVSSGTSVLDDLIPALLAIPFLEGGGVIPSAADGMVNDGRGGRLSVLHPQEMVLPANISLGLQSMIRTGGWSIPGAPSPFSLSPNFAGSAAGAAAGGMPVTINLSAIDSRSGAQFLMDHSRSIAKAIAAEQRNFNGRVL